MRTTGFVALLSGVVGVAACSAFSAAAPVDNATDAGADATFPEITPDAAAPGPAITLATNQQTPGDIVVDGSNIFWINQASGGNRGSIVKLAKNAGTQPVVLTEQADEVVSPHSMTSDATHLYFTDNNDGAGFSFLNLFRQDKAGGQAEKNQSGANGAIFGCAIQAGVVFWTQSQEGGYQIVSIDAAATPWTSTPAVSIAGGLEPATVLAVDATNVYAAASGKISKVERATGKVDVVAFTTGIVKAIVFDPTTAAIYWVDTSSVLRLDTNASAAPKDLAINQKGPSAIAFDGANIYWTTVGDGVEAGAVRSVSKDGGSVASISEGEVEPLGIAVDGSGVYWTNHGDSRIRMAPFKQP